MVSALKRLFWLAVLVGAGFAGWSLWNASRRPELADGASPTRPTTPVRSVVEPAERSAPATPGFVAVADWVAPADGACPASHPIKANDNSGIFHAPGGRFYDRTRAERCYASPDAAVADGYRAAKS